jgi:quercetin dioxygenase-like cupin family protein
MRTADPAVEDAMSLAYLAQDADDQKIEWLHGGIMSVLLDGDKTNGQLGMVRTHGGAGAAAPVHVHSHEDEVFLVLEGSGIFWVGDQRHQVSAGGVAYLPRGLPHAYRMTSEHFDVITLCTPAGVERFFRAAGWDLSKPKPPEWEITPATLAAAAAQEGQQILGPPLAEHEPSIPRDILARLTQQQMPEVR